MSDQDFRERVLSAIADLKRTTERVEDKIESVEDRIERIEGRIEQVNEKLNSRLAAVEKDVTNLHGDVRWIRGKLEGRQKAASNKPPKAIIWIVLGSALAAILAGIISLVQSFWT